MTDDEELAAIQARSGEGWDLGADHYVYEDRRTLLRMLNEARNTLFHAQQALLKEGVERDGATAENERMREAINRTLSGEAGYWPDVLRSAVAPHAQPARSAKECERG